MWESPHDSCNAMVGGYALHMVKRAARVAAAPALYHYVYCTRLSCPSAAIRSGLMGMWGVLACHAPPFRHQLSSSVLHQQQLLLTQGTFSHSFRVCSHSGHLPLVPLPWRNPALTAIKSGRRPTSSPTTPLTLRRVVYTSLVLLFCSCLCFAWTTPPSALHIYPIYHNDIPRLDSCSALL